MRKKQEEEVEIKELVRQAKRKDTGAFSKLYEKVYKDLYRFSFYTLKNAQDAEDAVSETVLDAFQGIGRLRNEEAFRAWIFKILTNKCKRKLKEYMGKTEELKEETAFPVPDREEAYDLKCAFLKLSVEERLITSMSVFGGYQSKEIAAALHMNHNTVRSRQKRALEKMYHLLSD